MKASELRDLLQDAIDKYGDLPVTVYEFDEEIDSKRIRAVPINSNYDTDYDDPELICVEIGI